MPFETLPWMVGSGPSAFLDAVKAGTDANLQRRGQDIEAQRAANELEAQKSIAQGRLAQALSIAEMKAQQAEGRLGQYAQHNQNQEEYWTGRNSLLQDQLGAKDSQFKSTLAARDLEDAIHQQNANTVAGRLQLSNDALQAKLNAPKVVKPTGPMVTIGGSKVPLYDPHLQAYLGTPQDNVTTNSPWIGRDTYTTNQVYPDINSLTNKSDLLKIFNTPTNSTASKRFRIVASGEDAPETITSPSWQ